MIERWAIRSREVAGTAGARARCSSAARSARSRPAPGAPEDPGDELDRALGAAPASATGRARSLPIPLSPWTSVARTTCAEQRRRRRPRRPGRRRGRRRGAAGARSRCSGVTSALPPTVVTASRSSSGRAAARPIASASSRPGSLSMISGSGCSGVPNGRGPLAPAGALWNGRDRRAAVAQSSTLWPALTALSPARTAGRPRRGRGRGRRRRPRR